MHTSWDQNPGNVDPEESRDPLSLRLGRPAFSLVLFDFDGTIADTKEAISHCLLRTLADFGSEPQDPAQVSQLIGSGLGLEDTIRSLLGSSDQSQINMLMTEYRRIYQHEGEQLVCLFPGIKEVLETLSSARVEIAVLSNKGEPAVNASLDRLDIKPHVRLVMADVPGRPKKPDARLFDYIASNFSIGRESVLMVGDTAADIQFAQNCNLSGCWASYGFGDRLECQNLSPRFTLGEASELIDIIFTNRE